MVTWPLDVIRICWHPSYRSITSKSIPTALRKSLIDDGGPEGAPIIHIDEHDLSWEEFGRLLTHAGWGMRVVFVPEDETHLEQRIEVREPGRNER